MKTIALLFAAISLTGCAALIGGSSETTCSGGEGAPCTSLRSAYQMSNHTTLYAPGPAGAMADAPVAAISVSLPQPVAQPMPVMEPAKVMRVWVNKWVDSSGDLNYPSLVFTEITPRRWAVGPTNKATTAKVVSAYRIEGNAEPDAAMVTSAGRPATPKPVTPRLNQPISQPTSQTAQPTPLALPSGPTAQK